MYICRSRALPGSCYARNHSSHRGSTGATRDLQPRSPRAVSISRRRGTKIGVITVTTNITTARRRTNIVVPRRTRRPRPRPPRPLGRRPHPAHDRHPHLLRPRRRCRARHSLNGFLGSVHRVACRHARGRATFSRADRTPRPSAGRRRTRRGSHGRTLGRGEVGRLVSRQRPSFLVAARGDI